MVQSVTIRNVANSKEDYQSGDVFKMDVSAAEIRRRFGISQRAVDVKSESELFYMADDVLEDLGFYTEYSKLDQVW
jgi:hypothetical protein